MLDLTQKGFPTYFKYLYNYTKNKNNQKKQFSKHQKAYHSAWSAPDKGNFYISERH